MLTFVETLALEAIFAFDEMSLGPILILTRVLDFVTDPKAFPNFLITSSLAFG